jgi:hypothetical protein
MVVLGTLVLARGAGISCNFRCPERVLSVLV